jgi:2-dehydropantoate 2-reductase
MTATSRQERLSVAIVGLGNIGAAAAGALRAADRHDVIACARRPIDELILERDGRTRTLPLNTLVDPAHAEPVDWVLLCCKAQDTPSTAPWLARLCTPATRVAVLQNGIDHVARVAPFAGGAAVVPSIVYYNGERLAPHHVRLRSVGGHDLVAANNPPGQAFAHMLDGTSLNVMLTDDFATLAWRKLLLNIVANPITALTLQRQSVLRRDDVHALCLDVMREAIAVGQAEGAHIDADDARRVMATLFSFSGELGTSMYFDRLAGRRLEIDALTGAIVAAGERHGIPTPLNRALLTLLRAVSDAGNAGAA